MKQKKKKKNRQSDIYKELQLVKTQYEEKYTEAEIILENRRELMSTADRKAREVEHFVASITRSGVLFSTELKQLQVARKDFLDEERMQKAELRDKIIVSFSFLGIIFLLLANGLWATIKIIFSSFLNKDSQDSDNNENNYILALFIAVFSALFLILLGWLVRIIFRKKAMNEFEKITSEIRYLNETIAEVRSSNAIATNSLKIVENNLTRLQSSKITDASILDVDAQKDISSLVINTATLLESFVPDHKEG